MAACAPRGGPGPPKRKDHAQQEETEVPGGTKAKTNNKPQAQGYDWKAAATKAHVGLEVPQASGGQLQRKVVVHLFEFDMDMLLQVYHSNLITANEEDAENTVAGLGVNVEAAAWKVWENFCTGVQRYQGLEDHSLAQLREAFANSKRLKRQAVEAALILVNRLQTREAKLAAPLSTPAS